MTIAINLSQIRKSFSTFFLQENMHSNTLYDRVALLGKERKKINVHYYISK